MTEKSHEYLEFEVSLLGGEPKVWRRFILHRHSTFGDLHKAIQVACGWKDYHLYSFSKDNPTDCYGPDRSVFAVSPHDEPEGYDVEPAYADKLRLPAIFDDAKEKEIFYIYDYGDGWIHSIKMLALHHDTEKFKRRLLAGARAFPLEDCGGLPGYQQCIDAFHDKRNAEEDLLHWMGKWNPEAFDFGKTRTKFDLPKQKIAGNQKAGPQSEGAVERKTAVAKPATNIIDLAERRRSKNTQ